MSRNTHCLFFLVCKCIIHDIKLHAHNSRQISVFRIPLRHLGCDVRKRIREMSKSDNERRRSAKVLGMRAVPWWDYVT